MPPVRHRLLWFAPESTWQVGSDDFTLPSLFAIVSRLILLGLTVGTIVYLLFPTNCEDGQNDTIPPLLYISLFVFNLVLFLTLINEAVIFSLSLRGRIHDTANARKNFPYALEMRVVLMVAEVLTLIVTTVGIFHPTYGGEAIECDDYRRGPLVFAKVIVAIMWLLVVVLGLALLIAVDPLGCCSPSIFDEIADHRDLGEALDDEGFILPGKFGDADEEKGYRCKRKYHVELGHRKMFRRFKALCCCFHRGGSNRSSSLAMQDAAKAFHTVFSDLDFVPTDVVAGLILLKRNQRRRKANCGCPVCAEGADGSCECLTKDLRDLTFEHMPSGQKPADYVRCKQEPFDFDDPVQRALFEDAVYYMHYCMGIYGWTLHLFQNPITGLCRLSTVTCCRFRCMNQRAGVDILKDGMCLCGLGAMRVQSKRQEEDIVFVTYENEVYQAPFSISVDHDYKTVVLAVRGTLSMKDALTDMSVTLVKVKIPGLDSDELYMHNGMYRTAQWIKSRVYTRRIGEEAVMSIHESKADMTEEEARANSAGRDDKNRQILRTTMERYWNYRLIVTGHSLGGGVAAILAVLLKPAYPRLYCYSFSPPGCIFSMPVAQHSESFITAVTLGNDLVIRTSFRSLLYLKLQVEHLVKSCKKPKSQVLFQSSRTEKMFSKVTEDPIVSLEDVQDGLIPDQRGLGIREIALAKKFAKRAKERLKRKNTRHVYIRNINQGDHIASYPPGRILHMEFTNTSKPMCIGHCFPNNMKLTWKSFEDFGAIAVDKGMVEDHLPTAIMAGLKRIRKQFIGRQYDPKETERIQMDQQEKYQQWAFARRRGLSITSGSYDGDTISPTSPCYMQDREQKVRGFEALENQHSMSQSGTHSRETSPHTVDVAVTLEENYEKHRGDVSNCTSPNSPHENPNNVPSSTTVSATATAKLFLKSLAQIKSTPPTRTSPEPRMNGVTLEMDTSPEQHVSNPSSRPPSVTLL